MAKKLLQQKGPRLHLGDVVRILDKGMEGDIGVVVEIERHSEWPWCCMLVNSPDNMRTEYWPEKYERLGNVLELVGVLDYLAGKKHVAHKTSMR
ncbi:MAG: hypothetical protein JNL05_12980 [Flavobacteriales bacterium]|nr:hypothetical protein [Flavobacteriales bacterium]